jgi:hypothetical protein
MDSLILPLGQHRLDPSPNFDPIRSLLRSLWTDTFWICERVASIAAAGNYPPDVRQELAYLRGDTDDALQNVARLIELLFAGYAVDLGKCIGRGNSPPYFRAGVSMAPHTLQALGQHELDPPPDTDPVRFFLAASKTHLVRLDECRVFFQRMWESDPDGAAREVPELRRLAEQARRHVARLIEVLLAGRLLDLARSGPTRDSLRLFRPCSEAEWFTCGDVDSLCKMLRHLDYGVAIRFSERKWRLVGVACVRRVLHTFKDMRTLGLVEVVERLADGLLTQEEVKHLWGQARNPPNSDTEFPEDCLPDEEAARSAFQSLAAIAFGCPDASQASESARWARRAADQPRLEEEAQVALLRDLFGNPYRPPSSPDPDLLAWNNGVVLNLAQAIYAERMFDQLPILADALEEAGCTDGEMLAHCRQSGPHTRGCWVVDLLLGKE